MGDRIRLSKYGKVYADDEIWDLMTENDIFKEFIGQCITHFQHFVLPKQKEIYQLPSTIIDPPNKEIEIYSNNGGETIYIYWYMWVL